MSMTMLLRRMKLCHYTVHGMRSSFRDYMGDMTHHAESTVEQALAHQVGDETSRAYRRGDAFLKRRQVLRDWETYLYGSARQTRRGKSEVTPIAACRLQAWAGYNLEAVDHNIEFLLAPARS